MREDKELREFRDLMTAPDQFEEGFGWGTVLMALFVGLVMAPAQLYMGLVAGLGLGGAPDWVTVILYVEICRRAFKKLKRPEIFILFYMCGAMMSTGSSGLLWQQFIAQSEQIRKMGLTDYIPKWWAPTDPGVLAERNFLNPAWWQPLGLMLLGSFIGRLDKFGLGYVLFRLTSDVEKLPFPMAPVSAMGMMALADASGQKETWRWRTFAMGGMAGIAFGFIYLAIPNITGAIFSQSIQILPIPFVDLTSYTEKILPAMPVMISFNLGIFVSGMVVPFWGVIGGLIAVVITLIANPCLYYAGVLNGWEPGIGGIQTSMSNTMDFYFSFGLGLSLAIGVIGIASLIRNLREKRGDLDQAGKTKFHWDRILQTPRGRGDIPIWAALLIYLFSTTTYVALAYWMINYGSGPLLGARFPLWILIFYGFVYTPIISYISTRMVGVMGMGIGIPFVKEASFILSGYKGAAIWFAPIPLSDYAGQASYFRTTELTGTRFSSIIKAEILIFPIVFVATIAFSQLIWSLGPVPSEMFPYANQYWELQAYQSALMWTSTLPGEAASPFREAFKPEYIAIGLILALAVYTALDRFGLPIFLVYGVVIGLNQNIPDAIIPLLAGALFGRFVCRKKFGDNWPKYRIVFAAGFGAGMGLIMMFSIGFVLMTKSVIRLPV